MPLWITIPLGIGSTLLAIDIAVAGYLLYRVCR